MRSEVKERLMDSKKAAARQISSVRASAVAGTLDADELRERLLLYVLAKFGLAADEAPSRNLEALAEASLAKALAANRTHVAEEGRSPTCDGVRSVNMKQALLIMALQRELGVALDGMRAGLAETTDELADLVFATLGDGEVQL